MKVVIGDSIDDNVGDAVGAKPLQPAREAPVAPLATTSLFTSPTGWVTWGRRSRSRLEFRMGVRG